MSYQDIPQELRNLRQWLCWRYEDIGAKKPTKLPFNPVTGKLASVDNPEDWNDFSTVIKADGYSGIGFVFSSTDPYTFVDLDDCEGDKAKSERQIQIYKELDSYSEISPSGKGLHIIVRGNVLAGRRRDYVEIYSSLRYATFTGNVYNNKPIAERQAQLQAIWESMGSGPVTYNFTDKPERETDETIINTGGNAVNGSKFKDLWAGNWQSLYPSQSEADLALINMIGFYTQNRAQITRLFRTSQLGKRPKANRVDYVNWMINRAFDRMLPDVDIEGFKIALDNKQLELPIKGIVETMPKDWPPPPPKTIAFIAPPRKLSIPAGLMGEIAQFVYAASPRPVPEIALAASIGLMAGLVGRAYNVSGAGLNCYTILVAKTGLGKESMSSGINKIMNAIQLQVPTSVDIIGPSEIASGQALIKHLAKHPTCLSILGEFGLRMQQMSADHANSSEKQLKKMLLDLYNKSGHGNVVRPSVYADPDKNTIAIDAPSYSILAESTPMHFYGALSEEMIMEGLLPRFFIIEYQGQRVASNYDHNNVHPPMWLTDKIATLAAHAETISHHKKVIDVKISPEAEAMHKEFDRFCDAQINNSNNDVLRELWNRGHIKALKLSALVAVGVNAIDPEIIPAYFEWALDLVKNDIQILMTKFELGEIGHNNQEIRQNGEIAKVIKDYITKPFETISKYCQGDVSERLHKQKIVPYVYLNRRLVAMAAFRNDRAGATNSIKRALQLLVDGDKLREIPKNELQIKYGTGQRAFVVSDVKILD